MFKYWYVFPIFAFAFGILVGCGSSSSSNGNGGNSVNPNGICQPGYIYSTQYNCMAPCPGQPGYGIIPGSNPPQCTIGNSPSGYGYYTFYGTMNVTNYTQYQLFLQGQGICNQWSGGSFGTASCSSWNGGSLQIGFSGTTGAIYGSVMINVFLNGSWGYGGATVPTSGSFQPTNNNMSYSLQALPPYYLQVQVSSSAGPSVPVSLATDPQIRVDLYYQGIQFASVSANRGYGY